MLRRIGLPSLLFVALCSLLVAGMARAGAPSRLPAVQASPEATACAAATAEEASALATAFLDAFATGDVSIYDEILAPDYVHHWGLGEDAIGIEAQKERVAAFAAAFERWEWQEFVVIPAEDYVTVLWSVSSVQTEVVHGVAPSGVETVHTGINVFRIECGLIVESWNESDHLGRLMQAGVITDAELGDAATPAP